MYCSTDWGHQGTLRPEIMNISGVCAELILGGGGGGGGELGKKTSFSLFV